MKIDISYLPEEETKAGQVERMLRAILLVAKITHSGQSSPYRYICLATEDAKGTCPAPVVHGRWGKSEFGFAACSACGELHEVDHEPSNYCPNCGAKMDEDER